MFGYFQFNRIDKITLRIPKFEPTSSQTLSKWSTDWTVILWLESVTYLGKKTKKLKKFIQSCPESNEMNLKTSNFFVKKNFQTMEQYSSFTNNFFYFHLTLKIQVFSSILFSFSECISSFISYNFEFSRFFIAS